MRLNCTAMLPEDSFQHKGLRQRLVDGLRRKGITDERVLAAMNTVPRHFFFESGYLRYAYSNRAFPILSGQTISQPFTVAFQTQLLQVEPLAKILEIGTGSGYQTALLAEMGARIYTVERHRDLYLTAKTLLEKMNYRPHIFHNDGYKGLPAYAPFDRILVTAAAPEIPKQLLEQLAVGGRLVIPVGENAQLMTLVEKLGPQQFKTTTHGNFQFVPMLKGTES